MSLSEHIVSIMACAKCKGEVQLADSKKALVCKVCVLSFPIVEGTPVMLIDSDIVDERIDSYTKHFETETESIDFYNHFYQVASDYFRFPKFDLLFIKKLYQFLGLSDESLEIIDIGAGTGYYCDLYRQVYSRFKVYNVDFSIEGFKVAKQKYDIHDNFVMDAYNLCFKEQTVDVITTLSLTPFKKQNQKDIVQLITKITTPLKSSGYYIFIWPSNLTGKIVKSPVWTEHNKELYSQYYNHTREFIRTAFIETGVFSDIYDFVYLRPVTFLPPRILFSKFNTRLSELAMKFTFRKSSARILLIGKKR